MSQPDLAIFGVGTRVPDHADGKPGDGDWRFENLEIALARADQSLRDEGYLVGAGNQLRNDKKRRG